jgi:ATP synthase F1 complex assembly factor 2
MYRPIYLSLNRFAVRRTFSTSATRYNTVAAAKTIRKFWKAVTIKEEDVIHVLLDGRKLKTPNGRPVQLEKQHRLGAMMVAGEWESVKERVKSHRIVWTSMVARALDAFQDVEEREKAIDKLMAFLHRDTLCYHQEYPQSLVKVQEEQWMPLLRWAEQRYGVELKTTDGIFGIQQPDQTAHRLREYIRGFSPLKLAAFEQAVLSSKSFIISLALLERHINAQQAAELALAEILCQVKAWGLVEDGHDLEIEHIHHQLGAVTCVLLLEASSL